MKLKNILLSGLSLVLVAALAIGGTVAYLQDDDGDVNVMTLGAEVTGEGLALEMVKAFTETPFSGDERFLRRRIAEIEKIFTEAKK